MWLVFLVLHVIGLTGYNLRLRNSLLADVDRWTLATIMQTAVAIPMVFALIIAPPDLAIYTPSSLVVIVVVAVLIMLLHLTNVKALQYLEVGVYSVLFNLRIVFTTILGIVFLSENIIELQILGGVFIFLGVLTVRQKGRKEITQLGIRWGIAASIVISLLGLLEKGLMSKIGFLPYAIPAMLLAVVMMWAILLLRKQSIPMRTFAQPSTISLMVLRAMSAYGALLSLYYGAALSVYTYISSLSVITTVLFGVVLLKESDNLRQKITATALAVTGLTLILIANI
jgi:drug/metabolite transporter (DMT)-like permease